MDLSAPIVAEFVSNLSVEEVIFTAFFDFRENLRQLTEAL
jgi:hypothetical protein